ncbi:MAG: F0F1 ATP synthase subunit A, partial [Clostridia bacterium]|nr:F0F1 ATP synthase subunit A [Clostridia bacterium]
MIKSKRFKAVDILLLAGVILPFAAAIALKVLFLEASSGISITGAGVFFTVDLPLGGLPVTESQVNSWAVVVSLFFLCLWLTHGIREKAETKRQLLAEWIVEVTEKLVKNNMGEYFDGFAPFIAAILGLSAFSSLSSLLGLFPPTSDVNVIGGWAVIVFILITYYKMKCGPLHYLKSFGEPVLLLTPLNVISEFATPVSMVFRHYGNVMSGAVIGVLVAAGLNGLSNMLFGWLPGFLGNIPFLRVGIPAVLSVYFDLFSGLL